jgi:Flp pilus assembly protein CpaB
MAKSKEMQWIPSGGVLAAAIGAALLAAILVNVYISYVKSQYEQGARQFIQLKETIDAGTPIADRHLKVVLVPRPFLEALKRAIELKDKESLAIGKRAPRRMYEGEFLFAPDFLPRGEEEILAKPPAGYVMVTIPVDPGASLGPQLQPGAFVNIYGDFNVSGDERRKDIKILPVIDNVMVKALEGSAKAVSEKNRSYNNIQIVVRESQARELMQIQRAVESKHFTIALAHQPEGTAPEPVVGKDVLDLVTRAKSASSESGMSPGPRPAQPSRGPSAGRPGPPSGFDPSRTE